MITTTRLFELIGNAPNASKYLDDIAARASAGKPSTLTLACAVGLAAKCERAELATSLARRLLREYPDEIGLLQHAGTQTFIAGDYANAEFVWDACNRRREQLLGEKQLDRLGLRILGPSWVIAIGHIAHLDIYFKWRELTGRKHKAVLTIPVGFKIPNGELLDSRWRPFLEPEIPSDIKLTLPQVEILQDEFAQSSPRCVRT